MAMMECMQAEAGCTQAEAGCVEVLERGVFSLL